MNLRKKEVTKDDLDFFIKMGEQYPTQTPSHFHYNHLKLICEKLKWQMLSNLILSKELEETEKDYKAFEKMLEEIADYPAHTKEDAAILSNKARRILIEIRGD